MSDRDEQRAKRRVVGMVLLGSAVMMTVVALLAYSGVFEVTSGAERTIAMVLGAVAIVDFAMALYFLTSNPS
jgi:heme A synthase